jgi:hypothetical protein
MKPPVLPTPITALSRFAIPTPDEVEQMPGWLRGEAREWRRVARVVEQLEELRTGEGVPEALVVNQRKLAQARVSFFRSALAELEREAER